MHGMTFDRDVKYRGINYNEQEIVPVFELDIETLEALGGVLGEYLGPDTIDNTDLIQHVLVGTGEEVSNLITLDLLYGTTFEIELNTTDKKTLEFINIPDGLLWSTPIGIKVVCTTESTIETYPDNCDWGEFEEPDKFEVGKIYYLSFTRHSNGWHCGASGGYLNVIS